MPKKVPQAQNQVENCPMIAAIMSQNLGNFQTSRHIPKNFSAHQEKKCLKCVEWQFIPMLCHGNFSLSSLNFRYQKLPFCRLENKECTKGPSMAIYFHGNFSPSLEFDKRSKICEKNVRVATRVQK